MSAVKQAYSTVKESGDKDIITAETRLYEPEIHIHINTYTYTHTAMCISIRNRLSGEFCTKLKQGKSMILIQGV